MFYPKVVDEEETVSKLIAGASIARYGDGELKLCLGKSIKCQDYDINLSIALKKILKSSGACLVGIPRINDLSFMTEQKKKFWTSFASNKYTSLYYPNMRYYSSFITRPDSVPSLYTQEYFDSIKRIWEGKKVILINGDNRKMDRDQSLFDNCTYTRWEAPAQNAWSEYWSILGQCAMQPKDTVFVLGLGPTATVLAYELNMLGYQALDLGHIGMFYSKFKEGKALDFDKRKAQ
ncbi:MAG: GT-D fold domain-containing glycosyltransferase [Smithella sp.]